MLVLSRKTLEAIFIGDDIKVTLLQARDGSAKIGIEAPREMQIFREELIGRELAAAAVSSSGDNGRRPAGVDSVSRDEGPGSAPSVFRVSAEALP